MEVKVVESRTRSVWNKNQTDPRNVCVFDVFDRNTAESPTTSTDFYVLNFI